MTEAKTTAERVQEAVYPWEPISEGAEKIGAELDEARLKAAAWDARELYLHHPGDDDGLFQNWENAEFNVRMAEKNKRIAELEAEVATLTLKLANARLNLKHCSEEIAKRDDEAMPNG